MKYDKIIYKRLFEKQAMHYYLCKIGVKLNEKLGKL